MSNKKSDLGKVKMVIVDFLHLPVEETAFSPIVVSHPIFESGIVYGKRNGNIEMLNIMESDDNLEAAILMVEERIKKANNIKSLYLIIRKSYRLTFLKYVEPYLSVKDFSSLLANAWVSSENPNQDANVSLSLAAKWFKKADKRALMDDEDYQVYTELPDVFDVYRGVAVGRNPRGMSWTMSLDNAEWFAHRYDNDGVEGYVQSAVAKKEDVLAYFNTRDEDEIVISTRDLSNIVTI